MEARMMGSGAVERQECKAKKKRGRKREAAFDLKPSSETKKINTADSRQQTAQPG